MSRSRLFRTQSFRLALFFSAFFALTTSVLFGILYLRITSYAFDQNRTSIEAEIESLLQEARIEGVNQVAQEVDERSRRADSDSSFYLLQNARGLRVAGNVEPIPPVAGFGEVNVKPIPSEGRSPRPQVRVLLESIILPSGDLLGVGRDIGDLEELNKMITRSVMVAVAVSCAVAVSGGIFLGSRFVTQIDVIVSTAQNIIHGDLTKRIPPHSPGDELGRLSATLNQMLDTIETLMDTTRQISSDIAHDLRTPLARLRRRLEHAAQSEGSLDDVRSDVGLAINDLDDILSTFTSMLRIAELESGSQRAGFTTVSLSELFELMAETFTAVAEDSGQMLEANIEPGVTVRGDRGLLSQLFANLVENALRHCPEGSTVELSVRRSGDAVVASVADDGPGVPAEERSNIFKRFYRLERSRTTSGSGLGLALAAAIAKIHEVDLVLEDNEPGARFVIRFPQATLHDEEQA